ncbi:MAG: SURF1 family protein [Pseudomonadota bacterium]
MSHKARTGPFFRPAPILTLLTVLAEIVLINLGLWQVRRLEWKEALQASVDARLEAPAVPLAELLVAAEAGEDVAYLRAEASGRFVGEGEAHLYGILDGVPGYYIYAPLQLTSGGAVMVNRGFAPEAFKEAASRGAAPAAEVTVTGLLRPAETVPALARAFRPANQPAENMWFSRDPAAMAAALGVSAPAFAIDSDGGETDAPWPRGGVTRVEFSNNHLGYAITWFGLGAGLLFVYGAFHVKAGRLSLGAPASP